jgi:hypothetical protein
MLDVALTDDLREEGCKRSGKQNRKCSRKPDMLSEKD